MKLPFVIISRRKLEDERLLSKRLRESLERYRTMTPIEFEIDYRQKKFASNMNDWMYAKHPLYTKLSGILGMLSGE